MNEKEIMQKIAEAARSPESSFEDIRKRIESQTEEQIEESRRETLAMLEEKPDGAGRNLRRFAAAAASLVVIAGLGVGLIALALGGISAESADSSAVMEEAIMEEDACDDEIVCDSEIVISTETTDTIAVPESSPLEGDVNNSASEPEPGEKPFDGEFTSGTIEDEFEYISCRVDALGMNIFLPSQAYITGRNVYPGFELLEVYGMSEAELEANFKSRNIYYNAMWYDSDADVTEVVISMTEDDTSRAIFNLSGASEEVLHQIEEKYMSYSDSSSAVAGARYSDVSRVSHEQALFFRAAGMVSNRSGRSNHLQYMTIVNGMRIEITLIEHFGISAELTGEEPTEVSPSHEAAMNTIIRSVEFDRIKSNFWQKNRGLVFYGLITAVGVGAILIVLLSPEKKKPQPEGLQEEETQAAEVLPEDADAPAEAEETVQNSSSPSTLPL